MSAKGKGAITIRGASSTSHTTTHAHTPTPPKTTQATRNRGTDKARPTLESSTTMSKASGAKQTAATIKQRNDKRRAQEEEEEEEEDMFPNEMPASDASDDGSDGDDDDSQESGDLEDFVDDREDADGDDEGDDEEDEEEDDDNEEEDESDDDLGDLFGDASSASSKKTASTVHDDVDDAEVDPHLFDEEPAAESAEVVPEEDTVKGPMVVEDSDPDTSDDEIHSRNTIGKIPLWWYDDFEHLGYDLSGKKIVKSVVQKDKLDKLLQSMDDPDYGRTVTDPETGEDVKLTDEEVDMIKRIQGGLFPESNVDPYEPYVDYYTGDKMIHPINNAPEPKSRFVPSKWEHIAVMKIVRAIRAGKIKPKVKKEEKPVYDIWTESDATDNRRVANITAPKLALPGHAESYNPPSEYLFSAEEKERWDDQDALERVPNYEPKKYSCLRHVPAYDRFVQERFTRCLDLYLCPRSVKMRSQIKDPKALIPKIPKPQDFKPFPALPSLKYLGHTDHVTCLSVDPTGQYLASGSEDQTVRIWEISTTRCVYVYNCTAPVVNVHWNPNQAYTILAVAFGAFVVVLNPRVGAIGASNATDKMCESIAPVSDTPQPIVWQKASTEEHALGVRFLLKHTYDVRQVTWHVKGTYFATVTSGASQVVLVHNLQKQSTQAPFRKKNIDIQCVAFHPSKPLFFVASKTHVRIYNLQAQDMIKKLKPGVKWISSIDIHPAGDNVILGSYDRKLCWFDLDLSSSPYKTLRYHQQALRQVSFHAKYPLFASCSDDATVHVFHGMVYSDLMQNPLIVPVKILRGHSKTKSGLGVLDCVFHPKQPWLFTAGADKTINLFI